MKGMKNLSDLLAHELKDLYSAEKQLVKALPKMIKAADHAELREALENHLGETEEHVTRLDKIFAQLDISSRGAKCVAMEGIIEEGKSLLDEEMEEDVRDAAIICAAQRVEHYEIAGYGCARTFAQRLGHGDAANLLQQTLDEEKAADEKLTQIALDRVNAEAAVAGVGNRPAPPDPTNVTLTCHSCQFDRQAVRGPSNGTHWLQFDTINEEKFAQLAHDLQLKLCRFQERFCAIRRRSDTHFALAKETWYAKQTSSRHDWLGHRIQQRGLHGNDYGFGTAGRGRPQERLGSATAATKAAAAGPTALA
jgi:ferritin-like metal-binding protein YciE